MRARSLQTPGLAVGAALVALALAPLVESSVESSVESTAPQDAAALTPATWEYATISRSSWRSDVTFEAALGERRIQDMPTWGTLLRGILGINRESALTRDADEVAVLNWFGEQGWQLVAYTDRSRSSEGSSVGTRQVWSLKRRR